MNGQPLPGRLSDDTGFPTAADPTRIGSSLSERPTTKARWQAGAFLMAHLGLAIVAVTQLADVGNQAVIPGILVLLAQAPAAYDVVTVVRSTESPETARSRALSLARRAFVVDLLPHAAAVGSVLAAAGQPNPEPLTSLLIAAWATYALRYVFAGWAPTAVPGLPVPVVTAQPPGLDALLRSEFRADAFYLATMPAGSIVYCVIVGTNHGASPNTDTFIAAALLGAVLIALAWSQMSFVRLASHIVTGDVFHPATVDVTFRSFVAARPMVVTTCAVLAVTVVTSGIMVALPTMINIVGGMVWCSMRLWQVLRIALGDHRSYQRSLAGARAAGGPAVLSPSGPPRTW